VTDRGGGCVVIGNVCVGLYSFYCINQPVDKPQLSYMVNKVNEHDGGGGKEMVRSSGGICHSKDVVQ